MPNLANCKTCSGLISEEAIACPKCGQPDPFQKGKFSLELDSALGFVIYQTLVYTDNFNLNFLSNEGFTLLDDIPGEWASKLNDDYKKDEGSLFERFQFAFEIINNTFSKDQLKNLYFHINSICAINSKKEKSILIFGILNVHIALSDEEKVGVISENILVDHINKNDNIQLCPNCSFPIEYKVFQSSAICPNCEKYIKKRYSLSDWVWGTIAVAIIAIIAAKCSK
jgi:hypothetical protein